jgi:CO/xanthine dehydrogenase FAD-binding subunit
VKPAPFEYVVASSAAEASRLLRDLGEDAKILAGGQSLIPMLNFRLVQPQYIIDINPVSELDYIRVTDSALVVGARTRTASIEGSTEVRRSVPLLTEAVSFIGHPSIRHRGTLGGSIAHADSSSELPTVAVALDAEIVVRNVDRERTFRGVDFFKGTFTTARDDDELVIEVRFPRWPEDSGFAFMEFSRRHGDFAVAGVAAMLTLAGGRITRAALALCGVGTTPVRAVEAERLLLGEVPSVAVARAAGQAATAGLHPSSDIHGSGTFRRQVAMAYVERAILRAAERAGVRA